jgi:hypothetical protein
LIFCRDAQSAHRWREGLSGYLVQQYGFGYGRIDLVAKHPRRITGDSVSPASMMSHPVLMAIAVVNLLIAFFAGAAPMAGLAWQPFALVAAALVAGLALERLAAGISAARRFRDPTPLIFPVLHLGRDLAWVAAIAMWLTRRTFGRRSHPAHSMRPRTATAVHPAPTGPFPQDIPARTAPPG